MSGIMPNRKQKKNKRPRYVYYDGPKKNCEPKDARRILELYVAHGLGYTPIRHILRFKHEHLIEDVVRQTLLGRNRVDGSCGELLCPSVNVISDLSCKRIQMIMEEYGTLSDPYNAEMLKTRRWEDSSAGKTKKVKICKSCKHEIPDDNNFCGFCGKPRNWKPSKLQAKITPEVVAR